MAGTTVCAPTAPLSPSPFPQVLTTRTRRYHGVFVLGCGQTLRVFSSRRQADFEPVIVTLGDAGDALALTGRMTGAHARGVAQALVAAADAFEREANHG